LLVLTTITAVVTIGFGNSTFENNAKVRTIELKQEEVNSDSSLKVFNSYEIEIENGTASFIGYDTIDKSDLLEYDLISNENGLCDSVEIKYLCDYDCENGIISLSVICDDDQNSIILDKIYGVIITNGEGEFDASFVIDDEIVLLSELYQLELIDNCGLFSKIKNAIKKVLKTTAGKIGTIATVAACAVVGTVCAVVPGCQLGTAVCIGLAVGAIGSATTAAVSTYQQNGTVDWETVGIYTGCGAIVGAASSAATYGATTAVKGLVSSSSQSSTKIDKIDKNSLPDNVQHAIDRYDSNGWTGNYSGQTSGTKAGGKFNNTEGILPTKTSSGETITYKEFDVNNYSTITGRDGERLIIGSDGKLYYTSDHYKTFVEIIRKIVG